MDSAVESQITIEIVGSTSEVDQRKLSGPFGLSKSRTTHPNLPVFWGIGIWKCSDRLAKNLRHRRIWTIIWCSMFQNTWTRLWEILQTLFETLFLLDSLLPHFHQGYKIGASSWIVCKDAPEGPKNANVFVVFVAWLRFHIQQYHKVYDTTYIRNTACYTNVVGKKTRTHYSSLTWTWLICAAAANII